MNKPRLNEDSKRVFTKYTGSIKPKIEAARREFDEFERKARKFGYTRLAPDEVVVKRETTETALSVVKSEHLRCLKISEKYRPYDTTIADFTAALNREVTK